MRRKIVHNKQRNTGDKGVISLEACIVLPIFIFLMLFIYGIMIMFYGQHLMMHAMMQSAESLSLDPYATERLAAYDASADSICTILYNKVFTDEDKYFSSDQRWYAENNDLMRTTVKNRFIGFLTGGESSGDTVSRANDMLDFLGIENGINGLDFSETTINGNILTIKMKYKQEFLFNLNGLAAFDREHVFNITLWDVKE